jgi:hypothetical protein
VPAFTVSSTFLPEPFHAVTTPAFGLPPSISINVCANAGTASNTSNRTAHFFI